MCLARPLKRESKCIQLSPQHVPSACLDVTVPAFLDMCLEDSKTFVWAQTGSPLLDEDQEF